MSEDTSTSTAVGLAMIGVTVVATVIVARATWKAAKGWKAALFDKGSPEDELEASK